MSEIGACPPFLNRLSKTSGSSTSPTQFAYGGDQLLGEYDGGGNLLRRYVPGPAGSDDPVVWYEGPGTGDRRWLIDDERGSVIAVANPSGVIVGSLPNTYDDYGVPGSSNLGRFQYTGQLWIPEIALYHYKARAYSPTLGRFMQTDPIGYKSDLDLYAYVGDDPINHADPTGQAACASEMSSGECGDTMKAQAAALKDVSTLRQDLKQLSTEMKAVAAGKQDSLSEGAKGTQAALNDYYGGSDQKTIDKVDRQASQVQTVLSSDSYVYGANPFDHKNLGQSVPGIPVISLGTSFFDPKTSFRDREVTLLHEPRHIFGANIFHPEAYEGAARGLPSAWAFDNADTFATFTCGITHCGR
jgi:RHS repeat-associated protein